MRVSASAQPVPLILCSVSHKFEESTVLIWRDVPPLLRALEIASDRCVGSKVVSVQC
jgi:hypothetical protein